MMNAICIAIAAVACVAVMVWLDYRSMRSGWIQTHSGKRFWPLNPRPEDVCIEDIAHALSNICRFGGHSIGFYSVAQHSLMVSNEVSKESALAGLLHDATEAYLGDVVRPMKRHWSFIFYRIAERRLEHVIAAALGVSAAPNAEVKQADARALSTERRDVMAHSLPWSESETKHPPFSAAIIPLSPESAEIAFLKRYEELTGIVPAYPEQEDLPRAPDGLPNETLFAQIGDITACGRHSKIAKITKIEHDCVGCRPVARSS